MLASIHIFLPCKIIKYSQLCIGQGKITDTEIDVISKYVYKLNKYIHCSHSNVQYLLVSVHSSCYSLNVSTKTHAEI